MDLVEKIKNLIALEQYDELDRLNQLELVRIERVAAAYLSPPLSLGLESLVP